MAGWTPNNRPYLYLRLIMNDKLEYGIGDLEENKNLRIQVFIHMLETLESTGKCKYVYHRLAYALFGEDWKHDDDAYISGE
jgi:hypothetical protein